MQIHSSLDLHVTNMMITGRIPILPWPAERYLADVDGIASV